MIDIQFSKFYRQVNTGGCTEDLVRIFFFMLLWRCGPELSRHFLCTPEAIIARFHPKPAQTVHSNQAFPYPCPAETWGG